jgi:hypothetical protein
VKLTTDLLTLPGLELRPLSHPARSQSLYRLHHRGSNLAQGQLYLACTIEAILCDGRCIKHVLLCDFIAVYFPVKRTVKRMSDYRRGLDW